MAELDPFSLVLDAWNPADYGMKPTEVSGLHDSAAFEVETSEQWGDGTFSGLQRLTQRDVTFTLGINGDSDMAGLDVLRVALSPRTNRQSQRLARFRMFASEPTRRFLYMPAPGRPLVVPGDNDFLSSYHHSDSVQVRLLARDPYLYEDAPTVTSYASAGTTHTIVNDGTVTATAVSSDALGAMSWEITVGSGGCVDPFVAHEDFGEAWVLPGEFDAGEVITVDSARVTRVDLAVRHKTAGPFGGLVPIWPALRPGDNDITVGCDSGALSATITTRSTW